MRNVYKCGAALISAALLLTACGGGSDDDASTDPNAKVELTWWHNAVDDPLKGYFQTVAAAYTAAHPNVTFKIEPIQNESIQTKITVGLQSNDPPDIFQQWGGGDLATQVESGKVGDISAATKTVADAMGASAGGWQVDGKQYGIPFSLGVVGFWYRKDLFEKAGITSAPTTMDELNQAVTKLKAKGIPPIALGGKDQWPDAFYWGYFATRECSPQALQQATKDKKFADPCFLKAGQDLQTFLATKPFQNGFLGTPAQIGAGSAAGQVANGKSAMELMGHWESGVIQALTPDKKPLGEKLGWFPFPAVTGGAGDPKAAFGGGDGFSCSVKAPPACGDFLAFLLSKENQDKFGETGAGLPVAPDTQGSVADKSLQDTLTFRDNAPFVQLYFDKALPTAVGKALNDEIANMFAGKSSPDKIVKAVSDAAANE
ncbi:MAG TPA: extracellular solute-binding protein [Kineosporiaceae bacterium]|nr:extracellular solute-binding protein [Kineosporiaceae bacterium]